MTDADYIDDLTLLVNTCAQAESLLHSLEKAAEGIGLYVNQNKQEKATCKPQTNSSATLSDGHDSVGRPARTYIHHLCVDTGYNLEDRPEVMDDREKRELGNSVLSARLDDDGMYVCMYALLIANNNQSHIYA